MLAVLMTKKTLNLRVWLALAGWLLLPQILVSSPVIDGRADWDVGSAVPFSPYHTTFRYDSFNRLQEQTFANGDHWSYEYNLTGTLKQKTDPKGQTTTYTYDSRQRQDVSSAPGTNPLVSDRDYDTFGRLSEVRDTSMELLPATPTDLEVATCSYTYDTLGRTLTETSYGRSHSYGYDLVGNKVVSLLKVQGDRERLLLQSYDAHNRLTSMVDDNRTDTTGDDKTTEYGYDLAGRVLLMKTSNGNTDVSATVNTYDVLGRLTLRKLYKTHSLISTNLLVSFTQTYDAFGNVVSQYETWMKSNGTVDRTRNTTMTYDQANRLTMEVIQDSGYAAVFTTYGYDGASNRTSKTVTLGSGTAPSGVEVGYWTYTYNDANQLKQTDKSGLTGAAATYLYDANGNRISQWVNGASRPVEYGWDAWDRLREVKVPTTATAQKIYRYSYDYRMRRIAMAQTGGGLTTRHTAVLYSGGLSVVEYNRTNNNTITNSTLSSMQYVRGPDMGGGVGGLLYTFRRSGDALVQRFNLSNGRGDIVAQTSNTGALTWTASYEAYGKQTKETGTNNDRQRANSKEEDPTGLLNEGHRYRDLETGVWMSRDPAGFVDGPNLYAYVKQNPWTGWDPEGLWTSASGNHSNDPLTPKTPEDLEDYQAGALLAGAVITTAVTAGTAPIFFAVAGPEFIGDGYSAAKDGLNEVSQPSSNPVESQRDVHNRNSEYPHDFRKGTREEIIEKNTNPQGQVIDPHTGEVIPREEITIEHKRAVVDHYNEEGYNQTAKERADWFNNKENLEVKRKSANSSEGAKMKKTYRQDVGPNYNPKTPRPPRTPSKTIQPSLPKPKPPRVKPPRLH